MTKHGNNRGAKVLRQKPRGDDDFFLPGNGRFFWGNLKPTVPMLQRQNKKPI